MNNKDDLRDENNSSENSQQISADTMKHIGQTLRAARLKAGLSLEQIADVTRINGDFVRYLEDGDLCPLPGRAFARGFIACLCKELKLDSHSLLAQFDEYTKISPSQHPIKSLDPCCSSRIQQSPEEKKTLRNLNQFWNPLEKRQGKSSILGNYSRTTFFLTGLGVVLMAIFVFSKRNKTPTLDSEKKPLEVNAVAVDDEQKPATMDSQESEAANRKNNVETDLSETKSIPNTSPKNGLTQGIHSPLSPADGGKPSPEQAVTANMDEKNKVPQLSLSTQKNLATNELNIINIRVLEPLDIRQRCDGKAYQTKRWEESGDISFTNECEITIFDAAAVELSFNGAPLGNLGSKNMRRNLSFSDKNRAKKL